VNYVKSHCGYVAIDVLWMIVDAEHCRDVWCTCFATGRVNISSLSLYWSARMRCMYHVS